MSKENIDNVLNENFDAVAMARVLIKNPDFVNKLRLEEYKISSCDTCNHCIAVMYNGPFECLQNI